MATDFTVSVGPGETFASLSAWLGQVGVDITAADILVFSHGGITGTISDDDSVTGGTSGATGTVLHCTSTQVLISSISGTFSSGEQVYETEDTNYVIISDAGDDPHCKAEMTTSGAADDTAVWSNTCVSDTDNRFKIHAASGHEAQSPIDTSRYRLTEDFKIACAAYFEFRDIQIDISGDTDSALVIDSAAATIFDVQRCIIKGNSSVDWGGGCYANAAGAGSEFIVKNCIIFDFSNTNGCGIADWDTDCDLTAINNTIENCSHGIYGAARSGDTIKNNLIKCGNASTDLSTGTYDYNFISEDNVDDPLVGANGGYNQTITFVDEGAENYHLASGSDGEDDGIGPGSDGDIVTDDFDGDTRSGATCDAGADERAAAGPTVSGSLTLGSIEVSGTVTRTVDADGSLTLGALEVDGTVTRTISVSGDLTLGAIGVSGTVSSSGTHTAAGDLTLGAVEVDGTVTRTISVSGDLTLGALTIAGSVTVTSAGAASASGDLTLGALEVDGTVIRTISVSGDLTLGTIGIAGTVTRSGANIVTGDLTLGAIEISGAVSRTVTALGDLSLGAIEISASANNGIVTRTVTGDLTLGAIDITATGHRFGLHDKLDEILDLLEFIIATKT